MMAFSFLQDFDNQDAPIKTKTKKRLICVSLNKIR